MPFSQKHHTAYVVSPGCRAGFMIDDSSRKGSGNPAAESLLIRSCGQIGSTYGIVARRTRRSFRCFPSRALRGEKALPLCVLSASAVNGYYPCSPLLVAPHHCPTLCFKLLSFWMSSLGASEFLWSITCGVMAISSSVLCKSVFLDEKRGESRGMSCR